MIAIILGLTTLTLAAPDALFNGADLIGWVLLIGGVTWRHRKTLKGTP